MLKLTLPMPMLRKFILTIAICLLPLSFALAATNPPPIIGGTLLPGVNAGISQQAGSNQGEKELNWLQNVFFKNTINKLIGWTAALSVVFLIIGGYQYLTAFGSDDQIKKAHKTITWSLVGVLLAMLAFAIVQIVVNLKLSGTSTTSTPAAAPAATSVATQNASATVTIGSSCEGVTASDSAIQTLQQAATAKGYKAVKIDCTSSDCIASIPDNGAQVSNPTISGDPKSAYIPQSCAAAATELVKRLGTASTAQTIGAGGNTCGGGKGVCKDYGTGWSGCWAGYSAYAAGAADCRSEKCCVLDAATSTTKTSASLLSAAVTSSYNQEIQSIVPCFGSSCTVSEIAALPQGDFRDEFLPTIARFLIYAMGAVSFIIFFAAGAILVFSWGEEETTKTAKNAIVWGITGIAFAAASYLLVKGISSIDYMKTSTSTTTIQNAITSAGGTDADGQAGYQAAQNCKSLNNTTENCKSCCASKQLNTFALSSCNDNCVIVPKAAAVTTTTVVAGEGGAACGGGKGICKNYGTGWSGCFAGYSAYDAGAADCRSEKCCVADSKQGF